MILSAVLQVFEDFRCTGTYSGDGSPAASVTVTARASTSCTPRGRDAHCSADGLTELTVLVRPYSAATQLRERMAALLA